MVFGCTLIIHNCRKESIRNFLLLDQSVNVVGIYLLIRIQDSVTTHMRCGGIMLL